MAYEFEVGLLKREGSGVYNGKFKVRQVFSKVLNLIRMVRTADHLTSWIRLGQSSMALWDSRRDSEEMLDSEFREGELWMHFGNLLNPNFGCLDFAGRYCAGLYIVPIVYPMKNTRRALLQC